MVRRAANLYERMTEYDNLLLAFHKSALGKQLRPEVIDYRRNLSENLNALRGQFLEEKVVLGEYRFFYVYEPKKRHICAAPFRERVAHHALMNVCEPVFERFAIDDSYACRKGRGLHAAIGRAQHFCRRFEWYLQLDIQKYFDTINHAVLMGLLGKRIKDHRVAGLFQKIVGSYETAPGVGMPIGNLISQHCANLYLGLMDHWLKEELRVKGYLRYMDDFVVFAQSKKELCTLRKEIREFLQSRLKLRLNPIEKINTCSKGIGFLGLKVFPHTIRLAAKSRNRFSRKFRLYERNFREGYWTIEELNAHMSSLTGHVRIAESRGFRNAIIRTYGSISEEGLEPCQSWRQLEQQAG